MRPSLLALACAAVLAVPARSAGTETAAFAGGCFWCEEAAFQDIPGVVSAVSGYTGGAKEAPAYEEVSAGGTGHAESVLVTFDPAKISYEKLLEVFWANVDPTFDDRQFCDHGRQYRPAIFTTGKSQKAAAEASLKKAAGRLKIPGTIKVEISPAGRFWPAEDYHQDYYKKNPVRYRYYRHGCGRDKRLREVWGAAPAGH